MPGKYRHYDGTPRNNRAPARLTDGFLAARWVEKEVLRLKKLGLSFAAISDMNYPCCPRREGHRRQSARS